MHEQDARRPELSDTQPFFTCVDEHLWHAFGLLDRVANWYIVVIEEAQDGSNAFTLTVRGGDTMMSAKVRASGARGAISVIYDELVNTLQHLVDETGETRNERLRTLSIRAINDTHVEITLDERTATIPRCDKGAAGEWLGHCRLTRDELLAALVLPSSTGAAPERVCVEVHGRTVRVVISAGETTSVTTVGKGYARNDLRNICLNLPAAQFVDLASRWPDDSIELRWRYGNEGQILVSLRSVSLIVEFSALAHDDPWERCLTAAGVS